MTRRTPRATKRHEFRYDRTDALGYERHTSFGMTGRRSLPPDAASGINPNSLRYEWPAAVVGDVPGAEARDRVYRRRLLTRSGRRTLVVSTSNGSVVRALRLDEVGA